MPTISRVLELTPVAGYLASNDVAKASIFQGGLIDPRLPIKIYFVYKILKEVYDADPNYENLQVVSNYLYELIQKYAFKAAAIVDGNTGGQVAPQTPTTGSEFPIYITNVDFDNATEYSDNRLAGKSVIVWLNQINRYLIPGVESSVSGTILTILLDGFDATQYDYNIVIENYSAGA